MYHKIEMWLCVAFVAMGACASAADYDGISAGDRLVIEGLRAAIEGDGHAVVRDTTRGTTIPVSVELSARQKTLLLNGGLLAAVAAGAVS